MTLDKSNHSLYQPEQFFELSLLWYKKNNNLLSKIIWTEYADIRRLAMIRLYLCNSIDWDKKVYLDKILNGSEIYVQIWKIELDNILWLGIKFKDSIWLIDKAYKIYYWEWNLRFQYPLHK